MTLRRPFLSNVKPVTDDKSWSSTTLATGVTGPFDINAPTGPAAVFVDPPGTQVKLFLPGSMLEFANRMASTERSDHGGPPPSILCVRTGALTNRSGKLRLWVSASENLQNGIWCEIERTTRDAPEQPYPPQGQPFPLRNVTAVGLGEFQFDFDDGGPIEFTYGTAGTPVRLRCGYKLNGNEVVIHEFETLENSDVVSVELAVPPPLEYVISGSDLLASVLFKDVVSGFEDFGIFPAQVAFSCPVNAALGDSEHFSQRRNVLQWTPTTIPDTTPIPISSAVLATVLYEGITTTTPMVVAEPTGPTPTNNLQHIWVSNNNENYFYGLPPFSNTPTSRRPDLYDRASFSVKNGLWWHEMSIVAPGTQAAVAGARHKMTINFPNSGSFFAAIDANSIFADRPWSFMFENPRFPSQSQLLRNALRSQSINVFALSESDVPLTQRCYWGYKSFPVNHFDSEHIKFSTEAFVQAYVQTDSLFEYDNSPLDWPSADAAFRDGMSQDAYDWKIVADFGYGSQRVTRGGARVTITLLATVRTVITFVKSEDSLSTYTGYQRTHQSFFESYQCDLDVEQCVTAANGGVGSGTGVNTGPGEFGVSISVDEE